MPEKVAVCTLPVLEEIVTRFVVDVYHVRRHRILNDSPIRIWTESVMNNPMKPLPDPAKLSTVLSLLYYRTAEPKGVVFEGLWYNSPELSAYRSIPRAPRTVSVKIDPNDLTRAWYFDTVANQHVELHVQKSMKDKIAGMSLAEHKMGRAIQRNNPELLAGEAGLVKAYAMIRGALEERVRGRDGLTNKRRAMGVLIKLQKKSAAMFEDAPASEKARAGDLADDLFGVEEIDGDYAGELVDEGAEDTALDLDLTRAPATANAERRTKQRRKTIEAEAPTLDQEQPRADGARADDMDELDRAIDRNLYLNKPEGAE